MFLPLAFAVACAGTEGGFRTLKSKALRSMALIVSTVAIVSTTGCARNNEPCNTDPSQIESARTELQSAEQNLESARTELADARQQKTQLENRIDSLPDVADLEARLEILKKGSGR